MSERRISTPVSEDTYLRFTTLLPWGYRSKIIVAIIDQLCDLMENDSNAVIKLVTGKARINIEDIPSDEQARKADGAGKDTPKQDAEAKSLQDAEQKGSS